MVALLKKESDPTRTGSGATPIGSSTTRYDHEATLKGSDTTQKVVVPLGMVVTLLKKECGVTRKVVTLLEKVAAPLLKIVTPLEKVKLPLQKVVVPFE